MSLCPKCGGTKNSTGSYCKACEVVYRKQLRQNNRDAAHLKKIKDRAKAKGIPFSLSADDLVIPEYCPVLGIKLERGRNQDVWPSVDRIDPNGGYTPDNIVVVSFLANKIKNNATVEQIRKVANFYEQFSTRLTCPANYETDVQ